MLVHQIMKSKATDRVVTIRPEERVSAAVDVLARERIGTVVVTPDDATVQGILSERDIVRELGRRGTSCMEDLVTSVMTGKVVFCTRSDTSVDVMRKMTDGRFRHMPVVEDGVLVGLISLGDVIKSRLIELSMEKESLEEMIKGGY
ncbi:MAG: CBS domain-containing protein [Oceanicola sp.]|nr:CBS domain-containing protein [Oceanicola sp.]